MIKEHTYCGYIVWSKYTYSTSPIRLPLLISLVIFKLRMGPPENNMLAKEIESWKGFEYALSQQHAKPF